MSTPEERAAEEAERAARHAAAIKRFEERLAARDNITHEDREEGFKGPMGQGKTSGSMAERATPRETLITLQPGRPRGAGTYVPFVVPEPADEPGHVVFALDIPAQGRKNAQRIVINRTRDRGAQLSIKEYKVRGASADPRREQHKQAQRELQEAADEIEYGEVPEVMPVCREVVKITSINVSDIVRIDIELKTATTFSNMELPEPEGFETSKSPDKRVLNDKCCCGCCALNPKGCGVMCFVKAVTALCGDKCCWHTVFGEMLTEKAFDAPDAGLDGFEDPHDMQSETAIAIKTSGGGDADFEFGWRVVSVGQRETDLTFTLAEPLKATCFDTSSVAATLANVIHYYKEDH